MTTDNIDYTLKSQEKYLHNSLEHGSAERSVYIDIIDMNCRLKTGKFTFNRSMYYGVEVIKQEYVSAENSPTKTEILEVKEIIKVPFEGKLISGERYYDSEMVDFVFMGPLGKTISKTKSLNYGLNRNAKIAVELGVNNDAQLQEFGFINFVIVD